MTNFFVYCIGRPRLRQFSLRKGVPLRGDFLSSLGSILFYLVAFNIFTDIMEFLFCFILTVVILFTQFSLMDLNFLVLSRSLLGVAIYITPLRMFSITT
jgi:hypothetical protein